MVYLHKIILPTEMSKKLALAFCVFAAIGAWLSTEPFKIPPSNGKLVAITLERGPFSVLRFASERPETSAIIIFASGDGGWGTLEETISRAFQSSGYEVIGIDSENYARTDYTLDVLQSDFAKIARMADASFGNHTPPLIVGGYSMGAAQAIAVAGGPHPPEGLAGLLLIDPCSRGRYGLRSSDQLNLLPTGPGTFKVDSFCHSLNSQRVVQWHAANDSIDSQAWLGSLTAQHKSFIFPNTGHDYERNRGDFSSQLVESAAWLVAPAQNVTANVKAKAAL